MYNALEYLERSAEKYPDKVAFADVKKEITYSELVVRAKSIGSSLGKRFDKNTPIPVFMEKGVDAISLFFGSLYGGCFYVMMDLKQPKTRLDHILGTLDVNTIVSSPEFERDLKKLDFQGNTIMLEELEGDVDEDVIERVRKEHIDVDPLYGIFTSGSTGVPKGVVVNHRSLIDFIDVFTETFEIDENEIIGNQAPWDFDVSVKDIYSTISKGATMQIIPKQYFSMPAALLDFMVERRVSTIIWAVSAVCIISTLKGFDYKIPTDLKKVMFSGEVMPIKHLNIWKDHLPDVTYVNLYGPTEITCNCTYHVIDKEYEPGQVIPIGESFRNERVFLLDEENKLIEREPNSGLGEICVSGTAVVMGYYNNKEQTERAFCQNPLNDKYLETIYRTGDLGFYDDNRMLCFSSRKDFQIKHMGHRIELGEVETAIDKVKEIVRVCCIFENNKIHAFYEGEIGRKDLHRELKKTLPVFMLPNVYIQIGGFPLNKNGKIDRGKLKEMIEAEAEAELL